MNEPPIEVWQEYTRRKRELEYRILTSTEYFNEVQKIADELGL